MESLEELIELILDNYMEMMDASRKKVRASDWIYQKDKRDLSELTGEDRLRQMGLTKKQIRYVYDILACAQSVHERDLELICQAGKETMKKVLFTLLLSIINDFNHLDEQNE